MIIDPRSTSQLGLKTLEQNQKELLNRVSTEAEARIIKTVDVLIKNSAPMTAPQRQILEASTSNLSNAVKVLLQQPALHLVELEIDGKPTIAISPTPLPDGSKLTAQLKALLNELVLIQTSPKNSTQTPQSDTKASLPIITNALRETLPKQTPAVVSQTIQTAATVNQLPASIINTLLTQQTQQLLKQLEVFSPSPTQLKDVPTLKSALLNSGLFLENQLAAAARQASGQKLPEPNLPIQKIAGDAINSNTKPDAAIPSQRLISAPPLLDVSSPRERLLSAWRTVLTTIAANKAAQQIDASRSSVATPTNSKSPLLQPMPAEGVIKSPRAATEPTGIAKTDVVPNTDLKGLLLHLKASLEQNELRHFIADAKTPSSGNGKLSADAIPALLKRFLAVLDTPAAKTPAPQAQQNQQQVANLIHQQVLFSLARIQHQQLQSLVNNPRLGAEVNPGPLTHLNIELPVKFMETHQSVNIDIEEEWLPDDDADNEGRKKAKQWKVTLCFDLPDSGGFYAQLIAIEEQVNVKFWADKPETLENAKQKLDALKHELTTHGVTVTDVQCVAGTPPKKANRLEYSLVDITT